MLPLYNKEISLLTILIIIHRSNNHLSITTTETLSPKWSLYTGLTVLSILSVIRHLICGNNLNWLINLNLTYETLWNGVRSCLLISMLGKLSWFRLTSLIANGSIDVKMDSCYLELLGKLQKRTCRAVGPSLAASLETLAHHHNVACLSLFYRYYFGRCFSELAQLVPLPFSQGRSTCYSDRLHDFSVTIPRYYKDVYVNSFFPHAARLWNSLPIECFLLGYDLSDFKSSINRHLLIISSF